MDLMAYVNQLRSAEPEVRARQARRAARQAALKASLGVALGREAGVRWNMTDNEQADGTLIGGQHPGVAALMLVRRAFSSFHVPSLDLRFVGMKRVSGHSAFAMDDGVVTIEASLQSLSGPRHYLDVPVMVQNGRALMPSVVIHEGLPRILAQSTLDDIVGRGEFQANTPDRKHMFAPPQEKAKGGKSTHSIVRPSMFNVTSGRALVQGALSGFCHEAALSDEDQKRISGLIRSLVEAGYGDLLDQELLPLIRELEDKGAPQSYIDEETLKIVERLAEQYACEQCEGAGGQDDSACLACGGYGVGMRGHEPHEAAGSFGGEGAQVLRRVDPNERDLIEDMRRKNLESYLFPDSDSIDPELRAQVLREQDDRLRYMVPKLSPALEDTVDLKPPVIEGKPLRKPRPRSADVHGRTAFYEPDVSGLVEPGTLGRDVPGALGSHLDVGERMPVGTFAPGQEVKTKREHTVRDRGGVRYAIPKGAEGRIVRDYDGADYAYIVRFDDLGFAVKMPREALS